MSEPSIEQEIMRRMAAQTHAEHLQESLKQTLLEVELRELEIDVLRKALHEAQRSIDRYREQKEANGAAFREERERRQVLEQWLELLGGGWD